MCPTISVPMSDVPDESKPVEPGRYTVEVVEPPEVKRNFKDTGDVLVLSMKILDEGVFEGRTITDRLSTTSTKEFPRIKLKNLRVAGGEGEWNGEQWIVSDKFVTEELVGKTFEVVLKTDTYQQDGETRETTRVGKYIAPATEQ